MAIYMILLYVFIGNLSYKTDPLTHYLINFHEHMGSVHCVGNMKVLSLTHSLIHQTSTTAINNTVQPH